MSEVAGGSAPLLLHDFFERSAERWPERIAIDIPPGNGRPGRCLVTYAELARRADALALLVSPFVERECVVAILLPRHTPLLYAAQLAVLKAGAAYTCIDPAFPDGRIAEILEDSAAVALMTDTPGAKRARTAGYDAARVLDVGASSLPASASIEPPRWLAPESLAYTIYTSGTTGRPKAVMIEHRSIANLVAADLADFQLSPEARVSQNSSASYDSSVEEIWFAFAAGATLVVADHETVRLGPDLVGWLRRERITVFCPPPTLLRAMDCDNPEIDLPDLAFVYSGGEALPQDLSDRWAKGRLLENGYGPTECTVTALHATMRAGEPVHVGRPVTGLCAMVLNEALEEVPEGQWGELCVGGIGVARGYWNSPELTAEKFVTHPRWGRIYRTGDLAHRGPDGNFHCHGRIDSQVKIRGHRVELGEIEARLAACPGIRAAACTIRQEGERQALVAFLVPEEQHAAPQFDALKSLLQETFPSHMIPSRFGLLAALPVTVGGKLNRAALPPLNGTGSGTHATAAKPSGGVEAELAGAFQDVLGLAEPVSIHQDFFSELGGDSLRAAQLVSRLRRSAPGSPIAVRDVYEARTVAALAERIRTGSEQVERAKPRVATSGGHPFWATVVQTTWLALGFSLLAAAGYGVVFELTPWLAGALGLVPLILLGPVLFLVGLTIHFMLAVCAAALVKRCLVGRYRPLRAPVWGSFYVRNWMVQQVVRTIPWRLIAGTIFEHAALRALGARIGRRVHIHRGVNLQRGGWDLLEIGDDVTIAQDASLGLVELDDSQIVVGPVILRDGATVDIRAGLAPGTLLESNAWLTALSWLASGSTIPAGERWDGVPARPAGRAPEQPPLPHGGLILPPVLHGVLMVLARHALAALPLLVPALFAVSAILVFGVRASSFMDWLTEPTVAATPFLAAILLASLSVPLSLALEAGVMRALGAVPEGVISRWSVAYIRVWVKTAILQASCDWLSGTLFWPVWLRWAGMKIGRGCEISTITDVIPELIEIGEESFFADGIYLGGPRIHRGTVTLAATRLSRHTFLGNHAVVPAGQQLPEDVLLGVCTVANDAVRPGTSWFGHPPFELPNREVVECDRSLTYEPSAIRYWNRVFWELLRFTLPAAPMLVTLCWFQVVAAAGSVTSGPALVFGAVPLITFGAASALCLLVLALKWVLLGRVRPGQHPLWSCWCSRWDFLYVAWALYTRRSLSTLEGTLALSWYLRAMGARLGKRVVLGSGFAQVVDPDMLTIEDGATVHCVLQAHTFEDRVLKIGRIHIGQGATLGSESVPLYGADIGAGTNVAPHSVIMKHEHLLPGLRYEGAPTHPKNPGTDETVHNTLRQPAEPVQPLGDSPVCPRVFRTS